jgi:hypothetical protein
MLFNQRFTKNASKYGYSRRPFAWTAHRLFEYIDDEGLRLVQGMLVMTFKNESYFIEWLQVLSLLIISGLYQMMQFAHLTYTRRSKSNLHRLVQNRNNLSFLWGMKCSKLKELFHFLCLNGASFAERGFVAVTPLWL